MRISLAPLNGPDKAIRLSYCYFHIKQLKKQALDIITTFLLVLGILRETSGTRKQWLYLCKTQGIVHRDRNMFDEFSFHFNKELPVNNSLFEIYE